MKNSRPQKLSALALFAGFSKLLLGAFTWFLTIVIVLGVWLITDSNKEESK